MKATNEFGRELPTWDDGFNDSPVFVYCETFGPVGVVRAETWEDAWECVVDEIMRDADENDPDTWASSYDPKAEPGELAEGVYWRGSGTPANEHISSHLAQTDLNGHALNEVTVDELKERYGIVVTFDED